MKRQNYLSWEEYFMALAILTSHRSKDPKTQVGACIIDPKTNRVVSLGYNGFPYGCDDDCFPWEDDNNDKLYNKHSYVVHAELNAILSSGEKDLEGCIIYTTLEPCYECAKAIIQSGIKEVIYKNQYQKDSEVIRKMFNAANVKISQFKEKK